MGKPRVAINGFGRIGTTLTRIYFYYPEYQKTFDLVAIGLKNVTPDKMGEKAYMLKYDSSYGHFPLTHDAARAVPILLDEGRKSLFIEGKEIRFITDFPGAPLPNWRQAGVDIVIDATGESRDRQSAERHLRAGAKKVIITAPSKDEDVTIVTGVNEEDYDPKNHHIISGGSCTTVCLSTVLRALMKEYTITEGFISTTHAVTKSQNLLDGANEDLRRGRAAQAIIPTKTGAAKTIGKVIKELGNKIDGIALRVDLKTVSLLQIYAHLDRPANTGEINTLFEKEAEGDLNGYLGVTKEPLVSVDLVACPYSAVVDLSLTKAVGNSVLISAWYDNEWGSAKRFADLTALIAQKLGGN